MKMPSAIAMLTLAAMTAAAQPSGVLGNWKTKAGSIVRIERCGSHICLALIELINTGGATTDIHNPDPALRSRPLCGLEIGRGFTLTDPNHAAGGRVYDPKTGRTYRGQMTSEGTTLRLRGYVGISLFGASETWTRLTAPVTVCNNARPSR